MIIWNGVIYTEEQVISKLTFVFLKDFRFYKVNFYTGLLILYGKNKGSEFVTDKYLNSSYIIKHKINNEFFIL